LVGKLIYLTLTRPDISYAVQNLSQVMHSLRKSHLAVALRLLRFIKHSPGKGINIIKSNSLCLKGFAYVDWAKCLFSRRFVYGFLVFFLGSSLMGKCHCSTIKYWFWSDLVTNVFFLRNWSLNLPITCQLKYFSIYEGVSR